MELLFLGHAAVLLTSDSGQRLLIDPYEPGGFGGKMNYAPIEEDIDFVVCTHEHMDHCATHTLREGFDVVYEGEVGPFLIERMAVMHDEYGGMRRGGEVDMVRIQADGVSMVHASDVGQAPDASVVGAWRGMDVLLIPVGGFFTIGSAQAWSWVRRLEPRFVVPMHYRTPQCTLELDDVSVFQAYGDDKQGLLDGNTRCVDVSVGKRFIPYS